MLYFDKPLEGDGSCYGFWPCEDDDAYPLFIVDGN